jgi:phosphoribosylanthranilate isomerase
MKNLHLVSFVGVDEHTNLQDLSDNSSFIEDVGVEWSVLFSDSKSIRNYVRYPSYEFCKSFLKVIPSNIHSMRSLHLCGSVIDRYLKQESDIIELCDSATRIQLNLNINNCTENEYEKLAEDIVHVSTKYGHHIILQQNKTKEKFMKVFTGKATSVFSLLHDSSGGFGREITSVIPPSTLIDTGYAGGINPDNVRRIVDLIESNNSQNSRYYIDMESGVRENNLFSINKCRQVIQNIK